VKARHQALPLAVLIVLSLLTSVLYVCAAIAEDQRPLQRAPVTGWELTHDPRRHPMAGYFLRPADICHSRSPTSGSAGPALPFLAWGRRSGSGAERRQGDEWDDAGSGSAGDRHVA